MTKKELIEWDKCPFLLKVQYYCDTWYVQNGLLDYNSLVIHYLDTSDNLFTQGRFIDIHQHSNVEYVKYATQEEATFLKSKIDKSYHSIIKLYNTEKKIKVYLL